MLSLVWEVIREGQRAATHSAACPHRLLFVSAVFVTEPDPAGPSWDRPPRCPPPAWASSAVPESQRTNLIREVRGCRKRRVKQDEIMAVWPLQKVTDLQLLIKVCG